MTWRLGTWRTLAVLGLSVVMFGGGVLFTRGGPAQPARPAGRMAAAEVVTTNTGLDYGDTITALQQRLRRLPADHGGWASLGTAYVQQAAVTGDPTYYSKAQGALRRSLRIEPERNAAGLTGLAALAAARHEFLPALGYARRSQRVNPYSAANQGILADALQQLGRYRQARAELQRMLDLQPSVASFTRASYDFELRGLRQSAAMAMRRALELATRPSDRAFCLYYLGELAWNHGEMDRADRYYARGLSQDPSYTALLAGRAKVAAARGDVDTAIRRYEQVVRRLPVPEHLIAYADLLRSLGREREAAHQEAVVTATQTLFEGQGVNVDLELALFHADRGHPEQALTAARSAWQSQKSIEAADAYAWALHVNGRGRAALRYSDKAMRLGTRNALFASHRGMIERSLGRHVQARLWLHRALALNPHFSPLLAPRVSAALDDPAAS